MTTSRTLQGLNSCPENLEINHPWKSSACLGLLNGGITAALCFVGGPIASPAGIALSSAGACLGTTGIFRAKCADDNYRRQRNNTLLNSYNELPAPTPVSMTNS
jgi:hypothetical protein